jgi:hypothetical protein
VGFGLNEVSEYLFALKIFLRELSKSISPNLSDKAGVHSASAGPHRNIGSASARREHDFAKSVAAAQQFRVRANEHIPCKVAKNAQRSLGISQ